MNSLPRRFVPVLVAALVAACGSVDSDSGASMAPAVSVDTIDGIVHVSNHGAPDLDWRVGTPRTRIGAALDADGEMFGEIGGLAVGPDGRIYVGDAQLKDIRVFDPDGTLRASFGREGEGPGEFLDVDALRWTPAGRLVARDVDQGRLSEFEADGTYVGQVRLGRTFYQYQRRPTLWIDETGRIFDWLSLGSGPGADSLGVHVYAPDGSLASTVVTDVVEPEFIMLKRGDANVGAMRVPMTPYPTAAVDRSGRIVSGTGAAYELTVRDASGAELMRITRDVEAEPVPGWVRDTVDARLAAFADRLDGARPEEYEIPDLRPFFSRLYVDALDHWWVARDGDQARPATRYDVFAPDGRFLGEVVTPRIRLMQIGPDFLAGVATDELGVESVVVLPLDRGS